MRRLRLSIEIFPASTQAFFRWSIISGRSAGPASVYGGPSPKLCHTRGFRSCRYPILERVIGQDFFSARLSVSVHAFPNLLCRLFGFLTAQVKSGSGVTPLPSRARGLTLRFSRRTLQAVASRANMDMSRSRLPRNGRREGIVGDLT